MRAIGDCSVARSAPASPLSEPWSALTVLCFIGFTQVKQSFFPNSNTPLLFAHMQLPQGTEITTSAAQMAVVEEWLSKREDVVSVASFIGQGASRFMLTYSGEFPDSAYSHLIIRVASLEQIPALRADLDAFAGAPRSGS